MRALGRIALVGIMGAATLGLTMGNATALDSKCYTPVNDEGGVSCWIAHEANGAWVDAVDFHAYDEILVTEDLASNGRGVGAVVEGTGYKHPKSAGEGAFHWDLSFAEGRQIALTSCQTNGDSWYDCHTEYATA